jgi:hypothetical protein
MKKILLFLLIVSFNSYGEWVEFHKEDDGVMHIDKSTIKEKDGYVYWWVMVDCGSGDSCTDSRKSLKAYMQGDCKIGRWKELTHFNYKQHMGKGKGESHNSDRNWKFLPPDELHSKVLNYVCSYVD